MSTRITILHNRSADPKISDYHVFLDHADDMETLSIHIDGTRCDHCEHWHGSGNISIPIDTWRHMMNQWSQKGNTTFERCITSRNENREYERKLAEYEAELIAAGHTTEDIQSLMEARDREVNPEWWATMDRLIAKTRSK